MLKGRYRDTRKNRIPLKAHRQKSIPSGTGGSRNLRDSDREAQTEGLKASAGRKRMKVDRKKKYSGDGVQNIESVV